MGLGYYSYEGVQESTYSKYKKAEHLNKNKKTQLYNLLSKYESLFDGTLGLCKSTPVCLDLKSDARPYHAKPYPVPHSREATMREEIDHLVNLAYLKSAMTLSGVHLNL